MIYALLLMVAATCSPDISNIEESQFELHPALGMVITLESGT
jgi:hypothetical protein